MSATTAAVLGTTAIGSLSLRRPMLTPVGAIDRVYAVAVRVTRDGVVGHGRVRCMRRDEAEAVAEAVGLLLGEIGHRPWALEWPELAAAAAPGSATLALASVDEAMWDLGTDPDADTRSDGSPRSCVATYWSGYWLGESLDRVRAETAAAVAAGHEAVKLRLDPRDIDDTASRLDAIATSAPDLPIAIEAVGAGDPQLIHELLARIDTARVLWLEDPLPTAVPANTASLDVAVRIAGGEDAWGLDGLLAYLEAAQIDVPIVDLGRIGGPSGLAMFLREHGERFADIGVHLDPRTGAMVAARAACSARVWLEVMDWWERLRPLDHPPSRDAITRVREGVELAWPPEVIR